MKYLQKMNLSERKIIVKFYSTNNDVLIIEKLRVFFNIKRKYSNSGNNIELNICNIDNLSLNFILKSNKMELYIGYEERIFLAFLGRVDSLKTYHINADYITSIVAFDGNDILSHSLSSYTGENGVYVRDIIEAAARDARLNLKMAPDIGRRAWKHGYSFYGSSKDMLDDACKAEGLQYSVQNGVIQISKKNNSSSTVDTLLTMENGLIRYIDMIYKTPRASVFTRGINPTNNPYIKNIVSADAPEQGLKIYSLMRPDLMPGDMVRIQNPNTGTKRYRIDTIEHNGDSMPVKETELGTWTSTITLVE
ncbi:Hypothetical protein GbCGDNIH9_1562 [Granulibacter bethesdensis]|uniref:Phage-related protein n=1 Tax=Granulibacter bethesdensis TaxID=364410 RepID=A0AAC9KEN4_9PROT|nr:hypothetical protein [Granulibacter bethesdensis]APH54848.1 Hypothetical protein GbCGDNIH9_1562 [Granulibacter bethesdensis]APH62434.1 Hypothetical protein GbCGDNIH8_1562 [Granulibacter bethesdensis]